MQVVLGKQKNLGHSVLVEPCIGLIQSMASGHKEQVYQRLPLEEGNSVGMAKGVLGKYKLTL